MALKSLALDYFPPAILCWLHQKRGDGIAFEGGYATWDEAASECTDYDTGSMLARVLDSTPRVERSEAEFARNSVIFNEIEYAWPVLAGLTWAAARSGGRLNVLDFGGTLGSSYFQNRKFLQTLLEVRWNVVEQTHYVEAGQANIQDEQLKFYETIEDCLIENKPNIILLSSVLQYLESPNEILKKFCTAGAVCLIIDRTPFSAHPNNKMLVQRVPSSIHAASYPMWIFSNQKFKNMLEAGWNLVASNMGTEAFVQTNDNFEFSFQGMLMETRR